MPVTNLNQFLSSVKGFTKTTVPNATIVIQKKVTFDWLDLIVDITPSDEGVARGNWQVGINRYEETYNPELKDKSGRETITKGKAALAGLPPYAIVYIANSVPYIKVLDDGMFDPADPGPSKDKRLDRRGKTLVSGGYSTQAPAGITAVTFETIKAMFP